MGSCGEVRFVLCGVVDVGNALRSGRYGVCMLGWAGIWDAGGWAMHVVFVPFAFDCV